MKKNVTPGIVFLSMALTIGASGERLSIAAKPPILGPNAPSAAEHKAAQIQANLNFGKMPIHFVPNKGQLDSQVAYYVHGKEKSLYFCAGGVTIVLQAHAEPDEFFSPGSRRSALGSDEALFKKSTGDGKAWVVKLEFVGASREADPVGESETRTVVSYFTGKPDKWRAGLPTYSRIVYKDLWPGIDLVYYGTWDKLKYEFLVHAGADPSLIRLAYHGVGGLAVDKSGGLEIATPLGGFRDDVPSAYQEINGEKRTVAIEYKLSESAESGTAEISFSVGPYDKNSPLILDPVLLIYCGYVGGSSSDSARAVAVDNSGNAYITGFTFSTESTFPVKTGPDLVSNGSYDAFVAKVNSSGTGLVYCGYIGGTGDDYAYGIAVDGSGNAYVTGCTNSPAQSFPVKGSPDISQNGLYDAFVAKVNSSGTGLVYCGYIGGDSDDAAYDIAVDSGGNAYVTGMTYSSESSFPETIGPYLVFNGLVDAFVAKVNPSGENLVYCGYVGGSDEDAAYGIAVDNGGNAYIAGQTLSTEVDFPVCVGPDLNYNGNLDAFVAKVKATGGGLDYCGYIGGDWVDGASDIAIDSGGNAYVVGFTSSYEDTFPVKVGPDLIYNDWQDAFVAKVDPVGSGLVYCGYIGGDADWDSDDAWGDDYARSVAVDKLSNAYVVGATRSLEATFPIKLGPDLTFNGSKDAFVARVNSAGSSLVYCGYLGGDGSDWANGVDVDSTGNAYVVGRTESAEAAFPVIRGPDLSQNGSGDVFVAKIAAFSKDDLLVTWATKGVYYRNSDTAALVKLASPATKLTPGDLDADGIDDLIGIWPSQGGVWVKYSKTGGWSKISSTADWIASGDMNGDGRCELLGSWASQGVYYRNSVTGAWVKMASPATKITAGDLDADGIDDLIGIWPSQGGVWVKYSKTGGWSKLSSTADWIASGDMNGDGRCDLLGSWAGQGVYYRNSVSRAWVKMSSAATQIVAGYVDDDITEELLGMWPSQGGVWAKYSKTSAWAKIADTGDWIGAGKMRALGTAGSISPLQSVWGKAYEFGPTYTGLFEDLSEQGPLGIFFNPLEERNTIVGIAMDEHDRSAWTPGPGDPGFACVAEKNLVPGEGRKNEARKPKRK